MSLKVSAPDGVKVYNVTSGKTQPEWLSEGKKKSLKKNEDYRRRLELIQDFEFPAAAHRIKATPDGNFIFASGIHPPRVRCFETGQLSMKFERHLDAEIIDFQILSEDYSKVAFLCADRSIAFHAKFGAYHTTRVPKFGRHLAYYPHTADLLIAASANELYRLNLEDGRFYESLASKSPGINKLAVSPVHGLVGAAGEEGLLECFDLRQEQCAGRFDAASAMGCANEGLTAIQFDGSGLRCAVGSSNGLVAIFDLRSSNPITVKDHMYSSPIANLTFQNADLNGGVTKRSIVSADKHVVRVWDADSGTGITSIEPPQPGINDVLLWPDSGLIMMACDAPKLQAYFVPSIGPAPKWCSFLESLTEEMEESAAPVIYDDYRFVTREELQRLGMAHLIGTSLLRAYMHGFFLHNKLYQKAKAIVEPTDYATLRKQRIQSKLEEDRGQRITLKRKLPKVNAALAAKILSERADGTGKKAKTSQAELLEDDRFKSMFQDPAFAIDETAEDYRVLHPNAGADRKRDHKLVQEHFEELEEGSDADEDDEEDKPESPPESEGDSDNDLIGLPSNVPSSDKPKNFSNRIARPARPGVKQKTEKGPRLLAAKSLAAAQAFQKRESLSALQGLPLAERAERAVLNHGKEGFRIGGQREVTFTPRGRGQGGGRGRGGGSRGGGRGRSGPPGGARGRSGPPSGARGRSGPPGGANRGFSAGRGSARGSGRSNSRGRGRSRGRH